MKVCSACGLSVSEGATMCPACGAWVTIARPRTAASQPGGAPLAEPAGDPPTPVEESASPPAPATPAPTETPAPTKAPAPVGPQPEAPPGPAAGTSSSSPADWAAANALPIAAVAANTTAAASTATVAATATAAASSATAAASTAAPPASASYGGGWSPPAPAGGGVPPWPPGASPRTGQTAPSGTSGIIAWLSVPGRMMMLFAVFVVCLIALGIAQGALVGHVIGAPLYTLDEYRQLRVGQTYQEVDAIFHGNLGLDETSVNSAEHIDAHDGAYLDLWFTNGVLQKFSQRGLPTSGSRSKPASTFLALIVTLLMVPARAVASWLCIFFAVRWRGYDLTLRQFGIMLLACFAVGVLTAFLPGPVAILGVIINIVVYLGFIISWTEGSLWDALVVVVVAGVSAWVLVAVPLFVGVLLGLGVFH
jgi:hypothetical protein